MEKTCARIIPAASSTINSSAVEYSVIVSDLFNADGDVVGEIYGAHVRGMGECAEARDLTIHESRIFEFVEKLCAHGVTPAALRDVVYDSLPL